MRRALASLLVGAALASGCASTEEKPEEPEALAPGEAPPGRWHEIEKGDTLWSLARGHGLTPDEVAEVNGISVDATLTPGQLLFLPGLPDDVSAPTKAAAAALPKPATVTEVPTTLTWPLDDGVLLRDFSTEGPLPYEGLMIAAPEGTPVLAAADGEVVHVGAEGSYGTMVIVRHAGEVVTLYAHVDGPTVRAGDRVKRGQTIAAVGTSGRAESPQLHFQVRSGRTPVDPLTVLPPP